MRQLKTIKAWLNQNGKIIFAQNPFWGIKFENQKVYLFCPKKSEFEESNLKNPFEILQKLVLKEGEILFGFLSYEFASQFEPSLHLNKKKVFAFPDLCFFGFRQFQEVTSLQQLLFAQNNFINQATKMQSLVGDSAYLKSIKLALEEIKAGNLYEINLSRPFLFKFAQIIDTEQLSLDLWKSNSAPFSGYLQIDSERAICSASPECFLQKNGNSLSTFPIKGTNQRLTNPKEDQAQLQKLLNNPKEQAEHLMVVDLERNDLGKIAAPGSVKVKQFLQVHSFAYVHHLISEINCQTDKNIFEILKATFPSGSITGAPKIQTMKTIWQLENFARSAYTGCFGYIKSNGDALFSILIRSLLINSAQACLQVGSGIVADSEPDLELAETYLKAKSFFQLLLPK